ncbi:hypothetical protein ACWKWC_14970 [Geodermatophilus nigrescens]
MRSLTLLSRSALAVAAAAVLTACGGSDEGSSDSASSSSSSTSSSSSASQTSSAAPSSASDDPAVAAFCTQVAQFTELGNQLSAASPEQLPGLLQQAAAAFDSVQPPAEIASSWQVLGDGVQRFADTANGVDLATPEGQSQLQTAAQDFLGVASGPDGTAVQEFGAANCGEAAPTT